MTIGLVTAALLALQTRVKFKLDSNHKWSIEVDKKSAGDAAVKLLVQRLLPFLSQLRQTLGCQADSASSAGPMDLA